jgi:hypothetical protein
VETLDDLDLPDGPLTTVLVLGDRVGQGMIGPLRVRRRGREPVPDWWDV